MTNSAKWKEFLRWWKQELTNLRTVDDVDEAVWKINEKIGELQKGDNAKQ